MGRYKAHTNNRYIDNSYYKKALEKYEQRQQDKEKDKTSSKSSARDNTQQPSEKDVQDAIKGI